MDRKTKEALERAIFHLREYEGLSKPPVTRSVAKTRRMVEELFIRMSKQEEAGR